ncbi:hypothetical protein C4D60_Mb04t37720 [Musa balbisiana]|uniref:Uncharacterized protein n=1 Tax=Musa balbisiana TaxID=52838 RepID=A0A4S8KHL8_MUSBA|nr:hypothetical protein C4D60_Mb04t37720 [Musa balbisiana]
MLRKGLSKDKFMMDLHLLIERGKIAGKALSNLMTFHHHHRHDPREDRRVMFSGFSCRSMDPNLSFYSPMEVEFSCSNTPAYPSFRAVKRKSRRRRYHDDDYDYDAAAVAKVFDILNSELSDTESVVASPSPAPVIWSFAKSPAVVRQLRITDSPFPLREEEEDVDIHIDEKAEEFIRRFYEQLRLQQRTPMTPEFQRYRRQPLMGRA